MVLTESRTRPPRHHPTRVERMVRRLYEDQDLVPVETFAALDETVRGFAQAGFEVKLVHLQNFTTNTPEGRKHWAKIERTGEDSGVWSGINLTASFVQAVRSRPVDPQAADARERHITGLIKHGVEWARQRRAT